MKITYAFLYFFISCNSLAFCQKLDKKLTKKINIEIEKFHGDVGVYVKHLKSGKVVSINADSLFPTASLIKVPIMCGVFDQIEKGKLSYHQELIYNDSVYRAGEDILGSFKNNEKIGLSKVQMLSITTSDNTASVWLQYLVGSNYINNWLNDNGFIHTKVNARTKGRELDYKRFGWGTTTPKEMATLVEKIRNNEIISAAASEKMFRMLTNIYWDGEALSAIPPYVQAASKQGAVDKSRSEVVLVNAPHGDYVFCIITKNQQQTNYDYDNEGFALLRTLSKIIWNHFEPNYKWNPAKDFNKYDK